MKLLQPKSRPNLTVLVKLAALFLFVGLAFRLLTPASIIFSPNVETLSSLETRSESLELASTPIEESASSSIAANTSQNALPGDCDLFNGKWIADPAGPLYTNHSCNEIQDHQNCMRNGRPDSGYLYWRWKPQQCNLRKFNAKDFLRMMRNRSWAFIGDSILRNHAQSFVCILSQVEHPTVVYRDAKDEHKRWHFPYHNFTLSVIWSPFLLKAAIFEDINGVSSADIQLHLDKLDTKWTSQFKNFDYVVIAGGKWFLKTTIYHENNAISGCHYCPGRNLTERGFDYAYRRALQLVLEFIIHADHRVSVFFRTITAAHFENGEWYSEGTCDRTVPFKDEWEVEIKDMDRIMYDIELEEFNKAFAAAIGAANEVNIKLLDVTKVSLLRPDGHPGPYRTYQPFEKDKNAKIQKDCLHWCLPGPIDSWNDLIMEMLVNNEIRRR